jgi:putative tricarboxylic transport membrane protein
MKFNDAISGAFLLAIAVAILIDIQGFPKIPGQNVGPGAFPGSLAVILAGCSIALIIRGLKERAGGRWFTPGAWLMSWPHLRSFLVTVACLVFYVVASEPLGFIPCGIVILSAMFATLGVRGRLILPIALAVTLVIHAIFYKGLRVPLPWGLLLPIAW